MTLTVEIIKNSLTKMKNNEMKSIHEKLDKQDKILQELLREREKEISPQEANKEEK